MTVTIYTGATGDVVNVIHSAPPDPGPVPLPVVDSFTAVPSSVTVGASVLLSWQTRNADSVTIDNGIGTQPANGSISVTPNASTSYMLTATGPGGSINSAPLAVTVAPVTSELPVIGFYDINMASVVVLDAHVQRGARYVRAQYERFLTADLIAEPFHWTSFAAGGSSGPFHYPSYSLWLGDVNSRGVKVASAVAYVYDGNGNVIGAKDATKFDGALGAVADGPYMARIFAHDASGAEVANPSESFPPFGLYVDKNNTCRNALYTIAQSGSYEWSHPDVASVQPSRHWFAFIPKEVLGAREVPLTWNNHPTTESDINAAFPGVFPGGEPFNTVLPYAALTRLNYVPTLDAMYMDEHRPSITSRGITVTGNQQGYSADENVFAGKPRFPLRDGKRGVATLYAPTALWMGHAGAIYVLDSCRFVRIGKDGTMMTFAGLRHDDPLPPYWEEQRDGPTFYKTTTVGNWDASVPVEFRFPREGWALEVDLRTTKQDTSVPTVPLPPFGNLPPHLGAGPRFFSTCFNQGGRVLRYQFDKSQPNTVPFCSIAIPNLQDAWGMSIGYDVFNPGDAVLFVCERGRHAISMWLLNLDGTVTSLGDLIANPNGSTFGAVSTTSDRSWKFNAAYMQPNGLPKWDLARAEPILAPEGCWYDPVRKRVVYGALAQGELRSIGVVARDVQVCARVPVAYGGQSKWVDVKGSDGSFYPQGTLFSTAFDNTTSGRPRGWLAQAGVTPEGTPLTHAKELDWQRDAPHIQRGPGGRTSVGIYTTGMSNIANGMFACGSSGPGIQVFMKATLGEAVPDEAKINRGSVYYREHGYHLIHGPYGYNGPAGKLPLPFGENADLDYALHEWGH